MGSGFTFAVMGHNEAERLHVAVAQALDAADAGDVVWFVDSASTDGSAARAAALGAEVVDAPLGKGRAMQFAIERCRTPFICFIDGDLQSSDENIARTLRDGVVATDPDMLVGAYNETNRRRLLEPGIYRRLVQTLVPDAFIRIERPLSGQRALRADFPLGELPPTYGVETHLNLHIVRAGGTVVDWPIGRFDSPLRTVANVVTLAGDVARAILDLAVTWGRLSLEQRPEWDAWLDRTLAQITHDAEAGNPDHEIVEHLVAIAMPVEATSMPT